MDINLILLMDETTDELLLPEEAQKDIAPLFRIKPGAVMPGTRAVNGKMLHYTCLRNGPLTLAMIEGMIKKHDLDWQVVGMQSVKALPVYDAEGEPVLDEDGNQVMELIVHKSLDMPAIAPYLSPDVDENGKETPKKGYVQLSQFAIRNRVEWGVSV